MLFKDAAVDVRLRATPILRGNEETIGRYDHAFVAVSLFNSYYSAPRLEALIRWTSRHFAATHLPIFDLPHAYTLAAQRGSSEGVVRRVLEEGRKLHNRVTRIRADHTIDAQRHRILSWTDLVNNRDYMTIRIDVERAYLGDERLRDACLDMAGTLVTTLGADIARRDSARRLAVRYLLDELPLLLDSPRIFGSPASAFLYHRAPDLMTDLFNGRFTLKPSEFQGYFVVADDMEAHPGRHPDALRCALA